MRSFTLTLVAVAFCGQVYGQASVIIQYLEIPQPAHELIVYPRFVLTADGRRLLQVTDAFSLNLVPTTVFPPQILVRTFDSVGNPIDDTMDTKDISDGIYFDPKNRASIQMNQPKAADGLPEFSGVLSDGLRIVPVSGRSAKNGAMPHRVFRYKDRQSQEHDFVFPSNLTVFDPFGAPADPSSAGGLFPETGSSGGLHTAPYKIRPEVMMVSDTAHSSKFRSKSELLRYIGTFMNAVNLRYRSVNGMDIQLKLAGLVINNAENEAYVRAYGGHIIADQTLSGFADYINSGGIPAQFDLAYLMTGRDMAAIDPFYGLHPGVAGLAYVGGACTPQRTGMGEDLAGSYDGVHVAAHEIAHLLGCVHDGDPAPFYLAGSPGARHCPWDHGYIMSYKDGGSNRYRFSQCCVDSIKYLVNSRQHQCLRHESTGHESVAPDAPLKAVRPVPLDSNSASVPLSSLSGISSQTLSQTSSLTGLAGLSFHSGPRLSRAQSPPSARANRPPLVGANKLAGTNISPTQYCKKKYPQIQNVWSDGNAGELANCRIRCAYPPRADGLYLYHVVKAVDGTPCASRRHCVDGACV